MADNDHPLCVAANSNTIYVAAFTPKNSNNTGRPPILSLYSSQQYPTSLSSIQWKTEAASYINHWMFDDQSLPEDTRGYWCAVDDTGTFAIFSGAKPAVLDPPSLRPPAPRTIYGLLYDKPSKPAFPTTGGLAVPDYTPVLAKGSYPCTENGSCNGHLFVLPSTTAGAPSNFGFATYDSVTGFSFEMLDRTSNNFTTQPGSSIPSLSTVTSWDAFGYVNSRLVTLSVSARNLRTYQLDARGLPAENGMFTLLDSAPTSDCGTIGRGFYTNVNGRSYFSCTSQSKPGMRYVFSTDGSSLTKVTEVPERTDTTLLGMVPVPAPSGRAPTWALAYSGDLNGLYSLALSESGGGWKEPGGASSRAGIIGGVVAAVVVVIGIAGFLFWRRRRQQQRSDKTQSQEGSQSFPATDGKVDALADGNNSELKGGGTLPLTEGAPLPVPPQDAQAQFQQPQHQSHPQPHPYYQSYPQQQQYPQHVQYSSPPQSNPPFSVQSIPSAVASQPFTVPAQPYPYQQPLPPTGAFIAPAVTSTGSSGVGNTNSAGPAGQEPYLSNHPRPNIITTVGEVGSQTIAIAPSTSGLRNSGP